MAVQKAAGYVANTSGVIEDAKGNSLVFVKGRTRLRANHWAVKQAPVFFDPLDEKFDDDRPESATAAPGEKRA